MRLPGRFRVVLALALAPSPLLAASDRPFAVRAPETWVDELPPPAVPLTPEGDSEGTRYLLFDQQVHVGASQEVYFHTVWRVETTAGLQDASEIAMSFEPSFERLVLHHARVLRRGRPVWSFSPGKVRVAHAEEDVDARLYNDELTATILLEGLRVGDTVDYAYSIEGANPVLAGRFDDVLWFEYSRPVDRVRRRIVWERDSALRLARHGRAPEPRVVRTPKGAIYEWEARGARAPSREERTPTWFRPEARVEVSDFDGWADVARRARELFAVVDTPSSPVDAVVQRLGVEGAPEDVRIDRAVRFVQDDVRYLGLEMGAHSHEPHRPADTLDRRFGDCKDKSALLVAMLRRLEVEAWPALVSTRARQALEQRLPALFAFDHAIVAIETGGSLLFVDATASEQGGPVRSRRPPGFARALVLREGEPTLSEIPRPPLESPTVEVVESYSSSRWDAPAKLEVVTTYRGEEADDMRQRHARSTRADVGKRYQEFYSQEHPGIRALAPPRVEDDRDQNVLVVREQYEIPILWKQGAHEFRAWLVDERLTRPRLPDRRAPYALVHPDHVRHLLTIRLPGPPDLAPLRESVRSPAFALDAAWSVRGSEARLEYSYRSLRESVAPEEVADFTDRVDRAADLTVCRLTPRRTSAARTRVASRPGPRQVAPAAAPEGRAGWTAVATVGLLLLGVVGWGTRVAASRWRARRRRAAFASRSRSRPGEQPQRAILVNGPGDIRCEGLGGACGCGGPWREVERAEIHFDGRPMTVTTRRCGRCGGERTLYYRSA